MVSIPKILTNKTVLTGLATSSLKSSSLFGPVKSSSGFKLVGSPFDNMGKVSLLSVPMLNNKKSSKKIIHFKPDSSAFTTFLPTGLGRPGYTHGKTVTFR